MSRMLATGVLICTASVSPAHTQETYGPVEGYEGDEDTPLPLVEEEPCETEAQEDGAILVCRELTDSERYMSPLPKPVQSDRAIIPGLTDPPCWVVPRPGEVCFRFGSVPEPAIMVDVTAFPEPLSAEEAAQVTAVENEIEGDEARLGERIPIDLGEAD